MYVLFHTPYNRIVVYWHINNIPQMILYSQICCNTAMFYIAAIITRAASWDPSWQQKMAVFRGQIGGIWTPHSPVLIKISADKIPLNQLSVENLFFH